MMRKTSPPRQQVAIFLQPLPEPRPAPDDCFVCEFHGFLTKVLLQSGCQQAGFDQDMENVAAFVSIESILRVQIGYRQTPAGVCIAIIGKVHQAVMIPRATSCWVELRPRKTASARFAMAPESRPISSYA